MQKEEHQLLVIAVPTLDYIRTETVSSLFAAAAKVQLPAMLHIHQSSYVHDARNKCVDKAIASGASHILFIDSDMKFGANSIQRLIDHDKDIVAGLYYRKQPPHLPLVHQKNGKSIIIPRIFPRKELFEVFGTGTGFMLIKTKVFKKIKPPYFFFSNFHGKAIGEDIYFCKKAIDAGFKVWCDPSEELQLGHVGSYTFDEKDYQAYADTQPEGDVEDLWQFEL